MTAQERRTSTSLASIYALRMLGLFLVLPVFALEARHYPGGDDPALVGLAMGLYGLTQAVLQIPFGMASDRWGRKPVIVAGLLLFALGSFAAAMADTIWWLMAGRALQGAGAVSAAVSALLADQTRDSVRTKAMALIGISISLMFGLSLVLAPPLAAWIGLGGLFAATGVLALGGVAVMVWGVPPEAPLQAGGRPSARLGQVLAVPDLRRIDAAVFVLNTVQMAMWVAVPVLLVNAGLDKAHHWQVYLPALVGSLAVLGGVFALERRGHLRGAYLGAIGLLAAVQLGLWASAAWGGSAAGLWPLALLLLLFFCAFNVLETALPSITSRLVTRELRGTALGVYNMLQSLGLFCGGLLGGALVRWSGAPALFLACAGLALLWLWSSWRLRVPSEAPAPAHGQTLVAPAA